MQTAFTIGIFLIMRSGIEEVEEDEEETVFSLKHRFYLSLLSSFSFYILFSIET